MNELISVIIPTYNSANTIIRSLKSVINQTYENIEVIVVNDGSTDDTEEILKTVCDKRIMLMRHPCQRGAAAARNTGIRTSKGEFIAFQDSDDEWYPDKLVRQMDVMKRFRDVDIVYTDMERITLSGRSYVFKAPSINHKDIINPDTNEYQLVKLGLGATLVKKKIFFERDKWFDETLPRLIDLEFFSRLLLKGYKFHHLRQVLVRYHEQSNSISKNTGAFVIARKSMLHTFWPYVKDNKSFVCEEFHRIGRYLADDNHLKEARPFFLKAWLNRPWKPTYFIVLPFSLFGGRAYRLLMDKYSKYSSKLR